MRSLEWFLIQYECVIKKRDTPTQRLANGENVNLRAQARMAYLQVKECQSWPVNQQKREMNLEQNFPLDSPRGTNLGNILILVV